jgi:hypothetical protein
MNVSDRRRAQRPTDVRAAPFVTLVRPGRMVLEGMSARAVIPASAQLRIERVQQIRVNLAHLQGTQERATCLRTYLR